jgi:hypothetical protein
MLRRSHRGESVRRAMPTSVRTCHREYACRYQPARLVVPEILEPVCRELRVAHCVLDVLVAHIEFYGAGVVAIVGKLVAAGVPQHLRVDTEGQLGRLSGETGPHPSARRRDEPRAAVRNSA